MTLLKTFKANRSLNSSENGLEMWMAKSGLLCIYYTFHIALVMATTGNNKIRNVIMNTGVFSQCSCHYAIWKWYKSIIQTSLTWIQFFQFSFVGFSSTSLVANLRPLPYILFTNACLYANVKTYDIKQNKNGQWSIYISRHIALTMK